MFSQRRNEGLKFEQRRAGSRRTLPVIRDEISPLLLGQQPALRQSVASAADIQRRPLEEEQILRCIWVLPDCVHEQDDEVSMLQASKQVICRQLGQLTRGYAGRWCFGIRDAVFVLAQCASVL